MNLGLHLCQACALPLSHTQGLASISVYKKPPVSEDGMNQSSEANLILVHLGALRNFISWTTKVMYVLCKYLYLCKLHILPCELKHYWVNSRTSKQKTLPGDTKPSHTHEQNFTFSLYIVHLYTQFLSVFINKNIENGEIDFTEEE